MTKVLSVCSQKGGVGKTSTSISLAAGLARKGKKVLLIDMDSQANSSKVLLEEYKKLSSADTVFASILERKPLPVHDTSVENLSIVPGHILLSNTDVELTTAKDHREARLKNQLDPIQNDFDYVFIDCPPALGWLTLNSMTASDSVLVVVSPGYFELESIEQINKTLNEVINLFRPNLQLEGYLFTLADATVNSEESERVLRTVYRDKVLNTIIPRNTDLRDAHFKKQDVFSYRPSSKSAQAYLRLISELFGI